jgi:hypothetical protein
MLWAAALTLSPRLTNHKAPSRLRTSRFRFRPVTLVQLIGALPPVDRLDHTAHRFRLLHTLAAHLSQYYTQSVRTYAHGFKE